MGVHCGHLAAERAGHPVGGGNGIQHGRLVLLDGANPVGESGEAVQQLVDLGLDHLQAVLSGRMIECQALNIDPHVRCERLLADRAHSAHPWKPGHFAECSSQPGHHAPRLDRTAEQSV